MTRQSRDPDAPVARPRIAVLGLDLAAGELWKALGDDPSLARFDLVLVAAGEVPGLEAPPRFERRGGPGGALLAGGLERAVELARTGAVDAVAGATAEDELETLAPLGSPVDILMRGERRVLALTSGFGGAGVPPARQRAGETPTPPDAELERAAARISAAAKGLAALGVAKPRLALCALEGLDVVPLAERARREGVDLVGPLPAEDAFAGRADLVCTFTRDQTRLGLALAGREPTARVVLGLPFVRASEDPLERATRVATLRASVFFAARFARERGELVSEREERAEAEKRAKLSAVAISARAARQDRCPYCRRELTEDEPGLLCARCETPHHRACIHEHGRCTVHGCGATSVLRCRVEIPVAHLKGEAAARIPFPTRHGPDDGGSLLVEPPIDDPRAKPSRRSLAIELESRDVARGELVSGAILVHAPRDFSASSATFHLRATLEVKRREERPRVQPIVEREAVVLGDPSRGLLGRLTDGVASLLGEGDRLSIPAGTRRYPFSFRLGADHPATVENAARRSSGDLEIVTTTLEASLSPVSGGVLSAAERLAVR
jgi:hypothetical protein